MKIVGVLCAFLLMVTFVSAQGFLRANGEKVVDENNKEVVLQSINFGNWMVMEGYMMRTEDVAPTQHAFKAKTIALIGEANTKQFYDAWLRNQITEADIDSIKNWGFNSVRLPIHYEYFTAQKGKGQPIGYTVLDNVIKWCAAAKIYVVIDLHAAPGGQGKDSNISDYDTTKPSLWESEANKQATIDLWVNLAKRYANQPYVAAYDIINEPNWSFAGKHPHGCDETLNIPLKELMTRITQAIRTIDKKHIVMVEGNCWGNNYKNIFPLWDNNMVVSFHKYWSNNDAATIQYILDIRKQYNVPIWCGETGENSNHHFTTTRELFDSLNIGFAWWPMKKFDNITCFANLTFPDGYKDITDYWRGKGPKPSKETAFKTLMQLAENVKIQHAKINKDVWYHLFQQQGNRNTMAFTQHSVPGVVQAVDYDLGMDGFAYADDDFEDRRVSTGKNTSWNIGRQYRNDGVDIIKCTDASTKGFCVNKINKGEWVQYTIDAAQAGDYEISLSVSNGDKEVGELKILNGNEVLSTVDIPTTGDWKKFSTIKTNVRLQKGTQQLRIFCASPHYNFASMNFSLKSNTVYNR